MNWSDERYVRLYTRDTADLMAVGWEGRLVLYEMLRKADRAGIVHGGADLGALPEMLRVPPDICERGLERLVKRGSVMVAEPHLLLPNFLEAQSATQSTKQRQAESRARRRDEAIAVGLDPKQTSRPDRYRVTIRDPNEQETASDVTNRDPNATAGHAGSQRVTPSLAVPSLAVPKDPSPPSQGVVTHASKKRTRRTSAASADLQALTARIVDYLNRRGAKALTPEPYEDAVAKALEAGRTEDDLRVICWHYANEWKDDAKMREHLDPSTLFRVKRRDGGPTLAQRLDKARAGFLEKHGKHAPGDPRAAQPVEVDQTPPPRPRSGVDGPQRLGALLAAVRIGGDRG